MTKSTLALVGILIFLSIGAYYFQNRNTAEQITSFAQCEAAGYPVGESYPRQCWTPDGKHFVEDIAPITGEFYGTILGTVLLGPTCPVMRDPPDPQCADKPYATQLVLTNADGSRVIKTFASDAEGKFRIDIKPGMYAIRTAAAANLLPYCQSQPFELKVNDSVEVAVSCDTGIR